MSDKILIVDDDPELLRLIGIALQRAGYTPIAAQNAEQALQKVRSVQPALVILDVMLPGISGIDICRELRAQASTLSLPIIMLSAKSQVEDKIQGLEAGADEYLTKPINPKEMVARVASLIARTERLREAAQPRRGVILGVLGAKGGVGVTTMALNLAIALSQKGHHTVAVELRPQYGTFAAHLGQTPPETLAGLVATSPAHINERALKTHLISDSSGIEVLYGPYSSDERIDLQADQVHAIIETTARMAEFVVIDLPNALSPATEAALRLCDQLLLVTRPEGDSLAAGRKLLDMVKNWGIGRGVVDAVIVNHVPLAMGISIASAEEELGCPVISVIPPAADACALVYTRGRPLLISQPNNIAANKISELSERLLERESV